MPQKKRLCRCWGASSAHPKITYARDQTGDGIALKPFQPLDIPPMPAEDDLNAMFADLVDELGLDKTHREAMFELSPDKKWQIYSSKKQEKSPGAICWPDYYIDGLISMSRFCFDHDSQAAQNLQLMDNLRTALRTQQMSFVLRFIEQNGLNHLLDFLKKMDYSNSQGVIHTSAIGCIKALMNSAEGRSHVLAHSECINVIAQSLISNNIKAKVAALEILGALCLVPGGHKRVLGAMLHFQKFACERTRFQTLINDLDRSTGEYRDDFVFKTAVMSFINAVLNYGAGQKHVEFRLHLRYEFLMLGIQPVLDKLKDQDNATLNRHIEFFDMVRIEDERVLAKKFETDHIDTKSATSMFDLLRKKLSLSPAYSSLQSILLHLLQLPVTSNACNQWLLLDRIVQQVVLQTKEGDPDVAPLELDVKKVARQLANENQLKETQQKIFDIQKENDDLISKLTKKDRECEVKEAERDELQETLNKMRNKMDRDAAAYLESKTQLAELQTTITDLAQLVELERLERLKLEDAVKTGSLADDDKVGLTSKSPAQLIAASALAKFAAPPQPPPPAAAPPPPPPPMAGKTANGQATFSAKRKNIPEPKQPLKCFNWTKLPDNKVQGSIWQDIDDTKLYKLLDLDELEFNFSAYQRQDGVDGDTISRTSTVKAKELSVIDGRRAQNCTILLSKLKMTNTELTTAILNIDAREELPKDMLEQLLKFVPTLEETQMLGEHVHETEQMARADRFLFEMSRVDHYEQRLKALYYKKKFSERMADVKPKVEAVLKASDEVLKSKKLRKMLELVLAFGNYMNRGQRGNAVGFKIGSLSKIGDTKSSVEKRTTLLHYLADIVERKFPDLVQLEKEVSNVRTAAKVNLTELDAELNSLRSGLADIKKELEYQRTRGPSCASDKFGNIMTNFVSIAAYNFSELEEQATEMKEKFQKLATAFCEDPKTLQPDEFFGIFEQFLVCFEEARLDNERFRKMREIEEKRAQQEKQLKLEREKLKAKANAKANADGKGEFDDLISALRTGDVFGDDMAKMKRNKTPSGRGATSKSRTTASALTAGRDR